MKKQILNEEFLHMQKLAGIITESQLNEVSHPKEKKLVENKDDDDPSTFDVNQDWTKLKILGTETDHQGEWVIFADPEDPYLDEEGYSFAIEKRQIDQVANGKKIGVEDGSSISHYMTSQDAKNILNNI